MLLALLLSGGLLPARIDPTCIAVAPVGHVVAVGTANGIVALVDAATRSTLATFDAGPGSIARLAWSADGTRLFAAAFVTRAGDEPADAEDVGIPSRAHWMAWDVDSRSVLLDEESADPGTRDPSLAVSPDGRRLVTLGCEPWATLFDVDRGVAIARLDRQVRITARAWSSDGTRVFTGDDAGQVCAWSAHDGRLLAVASPLDGCVSVVCATADRLLVASGASATLVAMRADDLRVAWRSDLDVRSGADERIAALTCDPEGLNAVAATAPSCLVESWSVRDGRHHTLIAPDPFREALVDLVQDPRGDRVALTGASGGARVVDAIGGSECKSLARFGVRGGRGSLAWTSDGCYLVARGSELVVLDGVRCDRIESQSQGPR